MKISRTTIKGIALISTFAYQSYSTLAYGLLGDNTTLRSAMIAITVLICLTALLCSKKRTIFFAIKLVVCYFLIFGTTGLLYSPNRSYISGIISSSFIWLFLIIILYDLDPKQVFRYLDKAAFLILFCSLFEPFTTYVTSQHDGYMVFGMRVLTCSIIFVFYYYETGLKRYLFSFVVSALLIFGYGNRSALLICVILYVIGMFRTGQSLQKKITISLILVIAALSMFLFQRQIISILSGVLESVGISSRTLNKMIDGSISDNNGREIIWSNALRYIKMKWFTGYGIAGDRTLVLIGLSSGFYAHNVFLEILLDFGLIFGIVFIAFIIVSSLKMISKCPNEIQARLYLYVFVAAAIKLFFSSSIWIDFLSYWCLGIVFSYRKHKPSAKEGRIYGRDIIH